MPPATSPAQFLPKRRVVQLPSNATLETEVSYTSVKMAPFQMNKEVLLSSALHPSTYQWVTPARSQSWISTSKSSSWSSTEVTSLPMFLPSTHPLKVNMEDLPPLNTIWTRTSTSPISTLDPLPQRQEILSASSGPNIKHPPLLIPRMMTKRRLRRPLLPQHQVLYCLSHFYISEMIFKSNSPRTF